MGTNEISLTIDVTDGHKDPPGLQSICTIPTAVRKEVTRFYLHCPATMACNVNSDVLLAAAITVITEY